MKLADVIVLGVLGYLVVGLPVGLGFLLLAGRRIDSRLTESKRSVRLVLVPGAIVFWPLVLARLVRGRSVTAGGAAA
ncbi:MAG: hypothetical protein AAGB48_04940 [Planctomycetota bacterium]